MRLRLRDRVVELRPGRPLLMGIVNANPDSFSDAVRLDTLDAQVEHGLRLVADGADLVDVGGESGVTYTDVTAERVERERVVPLVRELTQEGALVSVDTWKPGVAEAALDAGAVMLNDVSGLLDERLADLAAASGAALVVTHTRAAPKAEAFPAYDDVVADVVGFLRSRCAAARARGVEDEQLVVDPGPDFAKSPAESVLVLRALPRLAVELARPVLLACSRKYFVGVITGRPPAERLGGTLAAFAHGVAAGAAIARLHDVREAADFLAVARVMDGQAPVPEVDPDDDALKWIRA